MSTVLSQHLLVAKMEENRPGTYYRSLAIVLHLVFDINLCAEVWAGFYGQAYQTCGYISISVSLSLYILWQVFPDVKPTMS